MAAEDGSESLWNSSVSSLSKEVIRQCVSKWEFVEKAYKEHMLKNPEIASKVESSLRFLSYVLPGRFGTSEACAELVYSASQLLTLMHDCVFRQGKGISICNNVDNGSQLVILLTVIEYVEVFIELGAEKLMGEAGKWLIVVILQIFKAALRFFLLYYYKSGIQCSPLIPPLDRSKLLKDENTSNADAEENVARPAQPTQDVIWYGSRTKRQVRTLMAAPKDGFRTWSFPQQQQSNTSKQRDKPSELTPRKTLGESLYISRPLIHLASMFMFGENSWKPWLLSCATDVSSLAMLGDPVELNCLERAEVSRRSVLLLFYLLRSPFYDTYSKARVIGLLRYLSDTIPGISLIVVPLMEYLPTWQKVYFYNWSN